MDVDVSNSRSVGELNKALVELEEYESTLVNSINRYETKRKDLDKKLNELGTSFPKMSVLSKNASGLSEIVGNAATIGLQLSEKVRQLDVAKNRVQNVELLIGNVIKLQKCLDDTQDSLASDNAIEAAKNLSLYLNMDERTIKLVKDLEKENVGLSILPKLNRLHSEVISLVSSSFDNYVISENEKAIQGLFKIFPVIHEYDVGLSKYGNYVANKIKEKAENHFSLTATTQSFDKPNVHVDLITQLLELVAQAIQTNESVVKEYYGGNTLLKFIQIIQTQCDGHAEVIFQSFKEKRNLSILLQRARNELTSNGCSVGSNSASNAQNREQSLCDFCLSAESLIADSVTFNSRIELFLNFLRRRLLADPMLTNENEHQVAADIRHFFRQCGLSKISQEIVSVYLPLEQLFLRELVRKAIMMDELDDSTKTFRLVDDVFFVVKKSLSRAISSGSVDAVCVMFNHANAVLADQLLEETLSVRTKSCISTGWIQQAYHLVHKRAGSGSLATGLLGTPSPEMAADITASGADGAGSGGGGGGGGVQVDPQTQYLFALNSVEACLSCFKILRDALEQYITQVFGLRRKSDLNKLQACLSDLIDSLSRAFLSLLDGGFDKLRRVIRPQVNTLTQAFNSVKRDLSEDEFEQYAVNDPWVESLLLGLQNLLKPFSATLSPGNYEKFVSLLADEVLLRLERFVQQKNYNRYGALQFDKELRCIFNFFSALCTMPCREKFARILQISKLLNLEKVEEVSYYGDTSNWRLSANEIRRLLTLRVDFDAEEIRRLHL